MQTSATSCLNCALCELTHSQGRKRSGTRPPLDPLMDETDRQNSKS